MKKKLPELDYFILESCRKSLSAKGLDLSHAQILKRIKNLRHLYDKFNYTQHNLCYLWTMYNSDPPSPPYNYCFETQKEAINFASRAKNKYNIKCEITSTPKGWRLVDKGK
jgi:hypothetical protein